MHTFLKYRHILWKLNLWPLANEAKIFSKTSFHFFLVCFLRQNICCISLRVLQTKNRNILRFKTLVRKPHQKVKRFFNFHYHCFLETFAYNSYACSNARNVRIMTYNSNFQSWLERWFHFQVVFLKNGLHLSKLAGSFSPDVLEWMLGTET